MQIGAHKTVAVRSTGLQGSVRQPERKAECLTCGKAASGAAEQLVASNIQTHQKPLLPGVAPDVPQLLLKPKPTLLGLPEEHRSSQTRIEHESDCHSLEAWKCLDEIMSQGHRAQIWPTYWLNLRARRHLSPARIARASGSGPATSAASSPAPFPW